MKRKFKTVMINNSTNINKTINHLSLKSLNTKKMISIADGNLSPGLAQSQNIDDRIPTIHLVIIGSKKTQRYINNKKPA